MTAEVSEWKGLLEQGQMEDCHFTCEQTPPTEADTLSKSVIRRQILARRDQLEPKIKTCYDREIRKRVFEHPAYQKTQIVLAYASYRSEVATTELIRQALADGKYVFVPKVVGEEMEFWQIMSLEDLCSGYKGIPEPRTDISFPEWIEKQGIWTHTVQENIPEQQRTLCQAMMWMPGAVFDRKKHRIGYGKGFYDRYLARWFHRAKLFSGENGEEISLTIMALAYSCQVVSQLPYEGHDILPDLVITETEILT